ncbi:MAG: alpha/beta fold hydrolase [Actinobacteria bacterium]|nr:alpha/beta fold hydrolase [Actinomycetota bacterium]MBT4009692.1 alpha/beta fold hydrolase [Actinomycetota bacterium]MBT4302871.1 alpha/beta fold hydrolase [Actinomycetota bacterium]
MKKFTYLSIFLAFALVAGACGNTEVSVAPTTTAAPATTTVAPTTTAAPATTTVAPTTTTATRSVQIQASDDEAVLGAILASEEINFGSDDTLAWNITYRSQSVAGEPIEVTGTILASGEPTDGPRPVLSIAHGTTGMADQCAPSLSFDNPDPDWSYFERLNPLLAKGWILVATDYEGMGGPGLHPYIVGESEARGVFDIVRAAQTIPELNATGPLVVWGHSQGGHAAMHVAERWQEIAPELDLVGVAAGAPPSQMPLLSDFLIGSDFQGYLVMVAAAFGAAYAELDLSEVISPDYFGLLEELELGCTGHIFETFNSIAYEDLVSVDDIFAIPEWNARLTENDTNQLPNQTPVLILHGDADEQIPVISSEWLLDQLCALDGHQALERRVYPGFAHSAAVGAYWPELITWLDERIAGQPATDQCPA